MADDRKGPEKPLKIDAPFADAVRAAMEVKPPERKKPEKASPGQKK